MARRTDTFPVPENVGTLLVFGGSFDPPTRAHIELPLQAAQKTEADWLVYVPASRSPLKTSRPEASDEHRIAMLERALADRSGVSISTFEIEQGEAHEASYTLVTLERFRAWRPDTTMRLLIGADQATTFHRWREPHHLIDLAEPLVMLRSPVETRAMLLDEMRPHWQEDELDAWAARIVEVPMLDISATEVRELLHDPGANRERLSAYLPDSVLAYIIEHGLYG